MFNHYRSLYESIRLDYDNLYLFANQESTNHYKNVGGVKQVAEKFIAKIKSLFISSSSILVYRHMLVDVSWIESVKSGKVKNLGKHWAYDKSKATAWDHDYKKSSSELGIVMTCSVNVKSIDWFTTLQLFFIFDESEIESELKLFPDSKFTLVKIEEHKSKKEYLINKKGYTM